MKKRIILSLAIITICGFAYLIYPLYKFLNSPAPIRDYSVMLPNGYWYSQNGPRCVIQLCLTEDSGKRGEIVVPPVVGDIAIRESIVIGRCNTTGQYDNFSEYFILNTLNGEVITGMAIEQWKQLLVNKYNITNVTLEDTYVLHRRFIDKYGIPKGLNVNLNDNRIFVIDNNAMRYIAGTGKYLNSKWISVPPDICAIELGGGAVYGKTRTIPEYPFKSSVDVSFIYDQISDEVQIGLNESEWKQILKDKYKIVEPILLSPDDFSSKYKK